MRIFNYLIHMRSADYRKNSFTLTHKEFEINNSYKDEDVTVLSSTASQFSAHYMHRDQRGIKSECWHVADYLIAKVMQDEVDLTDWCKLTRESTIKSATDKIQKFREEQLKTLSQITEYLETRRNDIQFLGSFYISVEVTEEVSKYFPDVSSGSCVDIHYHEETLDISRNLNGVHVIDTYVLEALSEEIPTCISGYDAEFQPFLDMLL